jgi:hypothetical protein
VECLDQLAINKKWIEEIADYNWEKNCMVYGELRGIGIVERVYCSTTDNFFMARCISIGSIASRFYVHGSVMA